jgi:hypothetical protein
MRAPETAAGRKVKCPKCGAPIQVAAVGAVPAATATKPTNKTAPPVKAPVKAAHPTKTTEKAARAVSQPAEAKTSTPTTKASSSKKETAAQDSWSNSPLLSERKWMIRTKQRFFFSNFSAPRYDITRMGEEEILGVAVGRPGFLTKLLWGANRRLRQFLTYKFEVHDGEEEQLLCTIRFPTPILNFRPRAEILDPAGDLLGSFTRKLFAFTVNYDLRDPKEEKIGTFSFRLGDFRAGKAPSRVALAPTEGAEWGFVTGETHMEAMELAKEGKMKAKVKVQFMAPPPALVIQIDPKAANRPETKLLLLAGAVVLKAYGFDKMFKV